MNFNKWPKIEQLHGVLAYKDKYGFDPDNTVVEYIAKIKLHGSNCSIQCSLAPEGSPELMYQSRERVIVPEPKTSDNFGFAKWASQALPASDAWRKAIAVANATSDPFVPESEDSRSDAELIRGQYLRLKAAMTADVWSSKELTGGMTVFGEWVGPNIADGNDACSKLPIRMWFIFGIEITDGKYIWDPIVITRIMLPVIEAANADTSGLGKDRVHIIPLHKTDIRGPCCTFALDFRSGAAAEQAREQLASELNKIVEPMDHVDPYISSLFAHIGVTGPGEGLVLMPVSVRNCSDDGRKTSYNAVTSRQFGKLMFKVKARHHFERRPTKKVRPAETSEEVPALADFAHHFVTDARCAKILAPLADKSSAAAGLRQAFVKALCQDVFEESVRTRDSLDLAPTEWASGLEKRVAAKAHQWLTRHLKSGNGKMAAMPTPQQDNDDASDSEATDADLAYALQLRAKIAGHHLSDEELAFMLEQRNKAQHWADADA